MYYCIMLLGRVSLPIHQSLLVDDARRVIDFTSIDSSCDYTRRYLPADAGFSSRSYMSRSPFSFMQPCDS